MKTKKEKDVVITKISRIFLATIFTAGMMLIILSILFQIPFKDGWDVANWVSLVVEIGIGVAIASSILVYETSKHEKSKEQQNKITDLIGQVKKITSELEQKDKDDKKYQTEQKEFAIHRARSYLSALHSIITVIVDVGVDPNYPPEHQTKFYPPYQQKKEIVRQLEYIVNQSDSVLEQSYLQRITDIIELARINPEITDEDYGYSLDTSHCVGIKSQIDELLKIMPNPEI